MKTDLFDFELPSGRIATQPVTPRDSARMMVVNGGAITDSCVAALADFFQKGDVIVFNNTRVIPARLRGKRGTASIEVTLHKIIDGNHWHAFAKPGKRLRIDDTVVFANGFTAVVKDKLESGEVKLEFTCDNLSEQLRQHGSMPLPPYMKRDANTGDMHDYQTVYAKHDGAVAAPTAGLHFTNSLMDTLKKKGVQPVFITLHVGAGTFLPVKVDDTDAHKMHSEYAEISQEAVDIINAAKKAERRIIAVGTTSLRALESAAYENGILKSFTGDTDIFITPGYTFKIVDILITNFHLPRSTLFMLVSAFAGLDTMKKAYRHAIAENYRFYSYGDACLLYNTDKKHGQ